MDFLIKNTKGLTLKTKGKYCTEDLVIEIDPSLAEGYMEIDELPEVGLPRVLYKLMLEEPEYYIWENDEWVQLNTKGGGGLIEVTELPEVGEENTVYKLVKQGGTVVPNSDYVEKVYFNTALSVEEVVRLLEQLTYERRGPTSLSWIVTNGESFSVVVVIVQGVYQIIDYGFSNTKYFISDNDPYGEVDFVGWNPNFNGIIEVNGSLANEYLGSNYGSENDKLINLMSTTPSFGSNTEEYYLYENGDWKQISGGFKEVEELPNVGNSNYTYILKKDNYEVYAKSEELGIFNFVEYMRQNGASSELVGVFDSKDQLPTSNIKISDGMSSLYFYYVKNDDLYIYGSFSAEGNVWTGLSDLMFPFGGEITSTLEITATETLYVLKSEGIEKYYRYTYIFELNMYQVDNGKIYNFTEIAKEQGLKVNAEAVTSLPSEPIESDLSTTFYVYYLKGDNAYVYNQNILGGWRTVSTVLDIPYNGEVSSLDEMTTNGLYVLYNDGYSYKELFIPSGMLDITNNGNTNVKNYAYVNVNVSAQPVLQQKTIDPIKSSQDITPDSGYDGLSKVTIRAIPDNYIIPSGTITVDSYSGPVSFDVTNYKELDLNLSLYQNEVELLGNKLTCISNKADEYTYIKIITYDAQADIYYDMFFDIKDAGTIIKTIQDDLEIRLISQSTHNSLKVGSSSGGSEYAVLTKNGSNNKFSMNVSEDITIYLTYE